jgi:holo-[acyl-carrier protein] synthase
MTVVPYVIGVGLDLVEVQTLEVTLRRTPGLGARLFRPAELGRSVESLAGHFAAKEALAKALGGGDLPWTDVEITSSESGAPSLQLGGSVRARALAVGVVQTHLSITHDGGFAGAIVILVAETRPTEFPDDMDHPVPPPPGSRGC